MGGPIANKAKVKNKSKYANSEHFRRAVHGKCSWPLPVLPLAHRRSQKAEQCFVAGLAECVDGDSVFREWAHSWAMRVIAPQCSSNNRSASSLRETCAGAIQSTGEVALPATGCSMPDSHEYLRWGTLNGLCTCFPFSKGIQIAIARFS